MVFGEITHNNDVKTENFKKTQHSSDFISEKIYIEQLL